MFDLEAIERRHAAGSPACEDIGDLIAEVKRLQHPSQAEPPKTNAIKKSTKKTE